MAGHRNGVFQQLLSPFLRRKLDELRAAPGAHLEARRAIELQYLVDPREANVGASEVRRHYEAEVHPIFEGEPLRGVERLYRRSIVVEPTLVCAAHCRWCVRGQYDFFRLAEKELERIARYIGEMPENEDLREVIITGGDPLTDVRQLRTLFALLDRYAPRIAVYRIGTRVPLHQPSLVTPELQGLLGGAAGRVEIALHVNHTAELFPEVLDAIAALGSTGVRMYNQSVLLRGLNDALEPLVELADELRRLRIENHYLFHCVPLRGMRHHRTSVARGLELARGLSSCGELSGRAKPSFTLITDVGKVTLYEGVILERRDGRILLQSEYSLTDRLAFNPGWRLPTSASVDASGRLRVWYEDCAEELEATA